MKEYVLCAAVWYNDNKVRKHQPKNIKSGIVTCGWRHGNCFIILFEAIRKIKKPTKENLVQGFLTSKGKFVNRKQAAKIAFAMKQIKENKYILISEDLY